MPGIPFRALCCWRLAPETTVNGFALSYACSVANQLVLWPEWLSTAIPQPPEHCPQVKSYHKSQNVYLNPEKLPALSVAVCQITLPFKHWKQRVYYLTASKVEEGRNSLARRLWLRASHEAHAVSQSACHRVLICFRTHSHGPGRRR